MSDDPTLYAGPIRAITGSESTYGYDHSYADVNRACTKFLRDRGLIQTIAEHVTFRFDNQKLRRGRKVEDEL